LEFPCISFHFPTISFHAQLLIYWRLALRRTDSPP
jgi:hypothetical protein